MNTTLIVVLLFFMLYLLFGAMLFNTIITQLGGKHEYLSILIEKNAPAPNFFYFLIHIAFIFFWPVFIISGVKKR